MLGVLARSSATVAIAAGLVFIVPGAPAQAAGEAGLIQKTAQIGLKLVASDGLLVKGAVRAALPGATLACTGPQVAVCAGVGVVVAGAVLYATHDTWMPWLENGFGAGRNESIAAGTLLALDWGPGTLPPLSGTQIQMLVSAGGTASSGARHKGSWQCKSATTGGITTGTGYSATGWYVGANTSVTRLWGACAPGSVLNYADLWVSDSGVTTLSNRLVFGQAFDPAKDSTVSATVDCVLPDGTTGQVAVSTVNPDGGVLIPSCEAAFGPGAHGTKIALSGAQTGQPAVPLSTISVPTTSALYPSCVGAGVACTYLVKFQGQPCVVGQVQCIDWAWRSQVEGETDYSCWFGPYAVAIGVCGLVERAYETSPGRLTRLNTDGNPMTWDGTRPSWLPEGGTSSDPLPVPGVGVVPVAPPAGAPGGAPAVIPVAPLPSPVPGATTNLQCWPSGGAMWNPVEWVLMPVQCALSWAFVPSAVDVSPIQAQLDRSGIGPSIAALTGAVESLGGAEAGCAGPSIVFEVATVRQVVEPFGACTEPMSTVASYAYALVSVVTVIGGASKIIASIGAGFGYGGPPPTWQQGTLF